MIAVAAGFLLTLVPIEGSTPAFCLLAVAAIVVDSGMTVNFVLGQRSIFVAEAEYRSRLNGLYMAFFFSSGRRRISVRGLGLRRGRLAASIDSRSWIASRKPPVMVRRVTATGRAQRDCCSQE